MSNSLREVCKSNEEAKVIALKIKEEGLPRVYIYNRLKDNGLSIRGLAKELKKRLNKFEIKRQIRNSGVE